MLNIYLADLVYDTVKTNYVVPLNVAYLAAHLKGKYADDVDIEIFKYPKELENRIKDSPPDVLGLANYSWNERLNHLFIKMAKRLNPNTLTVMGGPNIRTDYDGIKAYLSSNKLLDFYILFEGEEPFGKLIEQAVGGSDSLKPPPGCAGFIEGQFHFEPLDFKKRSKWIDFPSPYLGGWLDHFLTDPNMIPLFETNRGCPFGCVYCTWGIAALSKVRMRPLEVVYDELDYVAKKSANQVNWIFCDANFGILERDVEIARKIRQIMDEKRYPIDITLWHSKNTSKRNIEISKILKNGKGYIAVQSTDPGVLKESGRGNIQLSNLKRQIDYYRDNRIEVSTDILIGLPNETAASHLNSLITAFDLGFGKIEPYNIRMLPGSQYESENDRNRYGIETKFRPIFGAYGVYDEQKIFEIEESLRATKDMAEPDLESYKILHWLIYFCWNAGLFKPVLRFGQRHGANPALVLCKLSSTKHPLLADVFSKMKKESTAEWFETREEMISFYEQQKHFDEMLNNFVKLNFLWIAKIYQDPNIISALLKELIRVLKIETRIENRQTQGILNELVKIVNRLTCKDLLQNEFSDKGWGRGEALSYLLDNPVLSKRKFIEIEIYRGKEEVTFCNYYLNPDGKKDFSLQNLTRFLEAGGRYMLKNRIRLVE